MLSLPLLHKVPNCKLVEKQKLECAHISDLDPLAGKNTLMIMSNTHDWKDTILSSSLECRCAYLISALLPMIMSNIPDWKAAAADTILSSSLDYQFRVQIFTADVHRPYLISILLLARIFNSPKSADNVRHLWLESTNRHKPFFEF